MRNAGLDEAQAGIKISRRNINNLRYADDTTLMAKSEEELKSLLMKVKGEWKSWLKAQHSENEDHGIRSHDFMAERWGNSANSVRLYFSGLQNHCGWQLQQWNQKTLTPWKESYDQPRQHIKKQRHYFANKGPTTQGYGFSCGHVWMWELGRWRKLSAKELMLLNCGIGEDSQVSCTARTSNQSILKEISPENSLEGLMLKLKLQYFGHLMRRTD